MLKDLAHERDVAGRQAVVHDIGLDEPDSLARLRRLIMGDNVLGDVAANVVYWPAASIQSFQDAVGDLEIAAAQVDDGTDLRIVSDEVDHEPLVCGGELRARAHAGVESGAVGRAAPFRLGVDLVKDLIDGQCARPGLQPREFLLLAAGLNRIEARPMIDRAPRRHGPGPELTVTLDSPALSGRHHRSAAYRGIGARGRIWVGAFRYCKRGPVGSIRTFPPPLRLRAARLDIAVPGASPPVPPSRAHRGQLHIDQHE